MRKYFGTDGIRGEANVGAMSPSMVLRIGQAFGLYLKRDFERPKVLIGKDTRVSCYMLENILASGLCSVGVDVLYVGPLPTPGIAYLTRGMRASAGVMISASHNPYTDNGIKFFDKNGFKLPDDQELLIEKFIDDPQLENKLVRSHHVGRAKRIDDALGQYSVFLKERFPRNENLEGLRIIVDCANGAAYKAAPKVFQELGAEVITLHNQPNGFNINDNCGALHAESLRAEVISYKAHVGFALDGDGDRLIAVDEMGNVIDGDQVICMCALSMKQRGELKNNAIAVTIMSNKGLDIAMEKAGVKVVRTQVGDRYVLEEMKKHNLVLGGEQSGHLLFLEASTSGDGMIAALKILEMMVSHKDVPLSQLAAQMKKFPQVTKSFKIKRKTPLEQLPKLSEEIKKCEKTLGDLGRILFRYSGTELVARVTIEAPEENQISPLMSGIEKALIEELGS